MSIFAASPAVQKRSRDDGEPEISPGKRVKNFDFQREPAAQHVPGPPPTSFAGALAQQQQRALEMMDQGAMDREDVEMDMDAGEDAERLESNPVHPWTEAVSAPRMLHQHSNNSLSTVSSSSMPGTPLDLPYNEQWNPSAGGPFCQQQQQQPSQHDMHYPSTSNPTSFTDMNGRTHVFSSSPPLSAYPPPPPSPAGGAFAQSQSPAAPLTLPSNPGPSQKTTSGVMRMRTGVSMGAGIDFDSAVRELEHPVYYGWDCPRQSNTLNMGAHLI
ncbi:hypothetical protein Rt10032_c10g4161 [Rhodotorula toruloides]|uniref:Uncharacterized protein n=1 Tax=Rhodotorula toruloides TaxID=5286 RepID=A0A511KL10_RHOTO|nr:hypothetical protein Rt10032_c10g4161 [Rhodotorula toruloides]